MTQELKAVLLTEDEITKLQALIPETELILARHALANPIADLAAYQSDLAEVVSRARDGSSYINEDFPELLQALKDLRPTYAKAVALRD